MKLNFLGLSLSASFDANELEAIRIDRAARAMIRAEQRKEEVAARAELIRQQEAERRAAIAARVEELRKAGKE